MKTCTKCEIDKPLTDFYARGGKCKKCVAIRHKAYLDRNKSKTTAYRTKYIKDNWVHIRKQRRDWRRQVRVIVLTHYSGGKPKCDCCGIDHIEFLCIDHIDGGGRKHNISLNRRSIYVWLKNQEYPSGYRVLCHNCNMSRGLYGYCPHTHHAEKIPDESYPLKL